MDMERNLKIRHAEEKEISQIKEVYDKAKAFMRRNGNLTQWVNGYPSEEVILKDIQNGNLYVVEDEEREISAVFAFILGHDPTYTIIEDGEWINDRPYGTIHRIGSSGKYGGMMKFCLDFCLTKIDTIRIDTHKDNIPMLSALKRLGFTYCGIIYCQDGTPRRAFQLTKS